MSTCVLTLIDSMNCVLTAHMCPEDLNLFEFDFYYDVDGMRDNTQTVLLDARSVRYLVETLKMKKEARIVGETFESLGTYWTGTNSTDCWITCLAEDSMYNDAMFHFESEDLDKLEDLIRVMEEWDSSYWDSLV